MCEICFVGRRKFASLALGLAATGLVATSLPAPARTRSVKKSLPPKTSSDHARPRPWRATTPARSRRMACSRRPSPWPPAHLLYRTLARTGRYRVEMTRSTDVVCHARRARRRCRRGQGRSVSLFALRSPARGRSHGASFPPSQQSLRSAGGAGVAADENSADRFAGPHFAGVSPQVASILASLETRATRIGSATLASDIQRSFTGVVPAVARSAPQRQPRGAARPLGAQRAAGNGLPVEPARRAAAEKRFASASDCGPAHLIDRRLFRQLFRQRRPYAG